MARVLIGWELGTGPAYGRIIRRIAAALVAEGHQVAVALQRTDTWSPLASVTACQAPVWPGLLVNTPQAAGRVSTMVDILARLGLARAGVLSGMIGAWDAILTDRQPDLVVASFAPALLAAAQGRVRTASIGTGFAQPPADVALLPRLAGEPGFDEDALLDTVDADLRAADRAPLSALPALFAADHALVTGFAELDTYAATRRAPHCRPIAELVPGSESPGREVFVYGNSHVLARGPLWQALTLAGLPVRTHIADASDGDLAEPRAAGFAVERRPLPWTRIAAGSRLIVSHGGHGTACAALAAGVPHLVLPHDLEKQLIGDALTKLGTGRAVAPRGSARSIADAIVSAYNDRELIEHARALAPAFAARPGATLESAVLALSRP